MKTTVNLPNELMSEAQDLARRQSTTVKELIETGLRQVIAERGREPDFSLEDRSVDGNGLQPEFQGGWESIRDAIYGQSA